MSFVRTFEGDLPPGELGFTYAHEHIVCRPPYWVERGADDLLLDDPEKSLLDVKDFFSLGGNTIVDATAVDYGRDVLAVRDIGRKTGVQIIGTAGFNKSFLWDAKIPEHLKPHIGDFASFYEWIDQTSVHDLANFVIREVEEGLEGTSIRAGQVKFGTGYNRMTPQEEKTMKAVAIAHHETKAPVHSHTEAGTMGLEQAEWLRREGVDLNNWSVGHMDRNPDPFYHIQMARTGAMLSFDGIAKIKYAPESTRINCILNLVDHGFEDQILISGDTARKTYYKHYDYGLGLEYIISKWKTRFTAEATERGYDAEALVYKFFVQNPARCMTFSK
ncbi:phosphotriesterase family protein [Aureibacillus halotolerans]|uniref:Phosphotriesterase-related protein n=1 Tax=Aureibacillus halotolerans TaxID=1508390 RepID=A0A4R6U8R8_9BACI|nr:phosphotriesterase [Aureibacillus halotolerans]TDQ42801.1 phosphotriesterase-related protein [Aureibacillus halotolerans]